MRERVNYHECKLQLNTLKGTILKPLFPAMGNDPKAIYLLFEIIDDLTNLMEPLVEKCFFA